MTFYMYIHVHVEWSCEGHPAYPLLVLPMASPFFQPIPLSTASPNLSIGIAS